MVGKVIPRLRRFCAVTISSRWGRFSLRASDFKMAKSAVAGVAASQLHYLTLLKVQRRHARISREADGICPVPGVKSFAPYLRQDDALEQQLKRL